MSDTKYCACCKKDHPKEDFYRSTQRKDGLQICCKEYHKNYAKGIRPWTEKEKTDFNAVLAKCFGWKQ